MIGSNPFNPAMGLANNTAELAMSQAMKAGQRATAAVMPKTKAFGGAGIKQRFENVESRLDAIEGSGKDPVQSVQPTQEFVTGGSFGEPSSASPAPLASGSLDVTASPASLQEAMPSPGDPASDMFGTEFMRNASVGAAKMRINKKL